MIGVVDKYFWAEIWIVNTLIYLALASYKNAYGNHRDKKRSIEMIFFVIVAFLAMLLFSAFSKELDIPSIISSSFCEMQGTVLEIRDYRWLTGSKSVVVSDDQTERVIHFMHVDPQSSQLGDDIRIIYLKNTKEGKIAKWYESYPEYNMNTFGIAVIVYLLGSTIFYIFFNRKIEQIVRYKDDFFAPVYTSRLKLVIIMLALVRIQMALVIGTAIIKKYQNSWDWYWGGLLLLNYLGVFLLVYYRSHEFIIRGNQYNYNSAKTRREGILEEIQKVELETDGVHVYTEKGEMTLYCKSRKTSEKIVQGLKVY